jgi:hypothetical protein
LDIVQANPIPPSQTQRTPSFENPFWRKLRCALKAHFDRSANGHLQSLPDEAKAEIVRDIFEDLQLALSKSSPDETPTISAHHTQHLFEGQSLPADEQMMDLPTQIDNGDLSCTESSNQGLGLTMLSSESLHSSPREDSFTSPNLPRCKCKGNKCECPPWPTKYFEEDYIVSEDKWSEINDLMDGNPSSYMF